MKATDAVVYSSHVVHQCAISGLPCYQLNELHHPTVNGSAEKINGMFGTLNAKCKIDINYI